jgi:hypothetical protein
MYERASLTEWSNPDADEQTAHSSHADLPSGPEVSLAFSPGIKRNTARGSQDTSIAAAVSETLREALSSKFGTGTTKRSQDGGTSLCLSIEDPPGSSVLAGYTLGTVNVRLTGAETRSTNLDSLTL